ncbi:pilus assembly protein TadG-related protein [Desulfobulbus elongatus]|uniref:pilus assembly protein TadG-related protein n=1 Tax=Desulfobulbus elongatus TaxID=53332 RepID=UPI0004828260|nr:pilus assembly protein TadG-related protein [Desulfobulbus elongatus]
MQAQSLLSSGTARRGIDLAGNEHGAVAVSVALLLSVLLAVMAFAIDTAYLYLKKDQYQNGVEAAALAAVRRLCDGDWEAVARRVAEANGIPDDSETLTVETGFYDELDEFSDNLGEYRDFSQEPPSGRFVNAVHVRLRQTLPSLTGMNDKAIVAAEAVAYLRRLDIVSLDPNGSIRLGHRSVWEDTVFWANGNIEYPQSKTMNGNPYQSPDFTESLLLTAREVVECPVEVEIGPLYLYQMKISWGTGSSQTGEHVHTGMEPLTEIRPVDEATLDYWRQRADIVYTPDQAGQDDVYYLQSKKGELYYVDAASNDSNPRVIFFDAGENAQGTVLLGPRGPDSSDSHTPNGDTMAGLVFVATCPIRIQNNMPVTYNFILHVGGENANQTVIISPDNIEMYTTNISFDGVVFQTGKDFIQMGTGSILQENHIRIIARGSIDGIPGGNYINEPGLKLRNNSQFGPPCPPGMARLGLLQPSE